MVESLLTSPRLRGLCLAAAILWAPSPAAACGEPARAGVPVTAAAPGPSLPDPGARVPRPATEPADDGPVVAGAPSCEAELARSLFDAGKWAEAAPLLARVAGGETGDDEGNRQIARFDLAIALYRLGLYHASLWAFGAIAAAPSHYGFRKTLEWLAALDAVLPEPAGVVSHVGRYAGIVPDPAPSGLLARIHHLLGSRAYDDRRYEQAAVAFAQVERGSPLYPRSQFMLGMSYTQLRKSVPAVKAFARIIEAVGEDTPGEEAAHLRNLAWISMARAYYSASIHLDELCAPTSDMNRLNASAKYWGRVEIGSELWPEARLEESWFYFMAGDYMHALGSLHNLESPYFADSLYPEADVVRGIISFTTCQYDDATTRVARMRQRYGPLRRELSALIRRLEAAGSDEEVLAFHASARAGRASVPATLRPFVDATLPDRPIRKHLDHLRFIDVEEAGLLAMPAAFQGSALGEEVEANLALARRASVQGAAERIRALYQRRLDDIDAQLREATKLLVDVQAAQLAASRAPPSLPVEPSTSAVPRPDDEHVLWPFDGEFWRDELGSYRQVVVSRCGR